MRIGLSKDQIDDLVLRFVPVGETRFDGGVSIVDLMCCCQLREGTVRNSLKRLMSEKRVERGWDGNLRYGRYLYFAPAAACHAANA